MQGGRKNRSVHVHVEASALCGVIEIQAANTGMQIDRGSEDRGSERVVERGEHLAVERGAPGADIAIQGGVESVSEIAMRAAASLSAQDAPRVTLTAGSNPSFSEMSPVLHQ
jgi:hypothetical protein